ncbi:hypothetical protein BKN38_09440 [Helicobacter sp. CLO-3]|uniref:PP0621 family protein n=1 Tax=unclassified Helicobacter TaxID=2593540 RepID=UPI00080515EC|nr:MULTISPECIES: PP0621 family protein [unclassified Helicobacter]OBV28651.1 hypothetical protein BA723_08670 [Helicobacter sp. CLO-3]OHU81269.1 hypothetical protein BKN38_09440 [Helicobacter sp. CLO-3]
MIRILVILVLVCVLVYLTRRALKGIWRSISGAQNSENIGQNGRENGRDSACENRAQGREQRQEQRREQRHEIEGYDMVECATCGTFISKKEAINYQGKNYCSKSCLG